MLHLQESSLRERKLSGARRRRSELESLGRAHVLKPGKVFGVATPRGNVVYKQSDAPWLEAAAAALGPLAGVGTVRAIPTLRWSCGPLPFAAPRATWVLALPWIDAPTLAESKAGFDARALGRLWAFDVLIDNSDRLLKGGNPRNLLVGRGGSLFALDQCLGPAVLGSADAARVTRKRLSRVASNSMRERVGRDLFADFHREAAIRISQIDRQARAFSRGVTEGIHSVAALDASALRRAIAAVCVARHVKTPGFEAILQQFREVKS
jgi:hypothetical protein